MVFWRLLGEGLWKGKAFLAEGSARQGGEKPPEVGQESGVVGMWDQTGSVVRRGWRGQ